MKVNFLNFWIFFLLISIGGCSSNDDVIERENELIFDGETYPFIDGNLLIYNNLDPIFQYEIALYSSQLDQDADPIDQVYHVFDFKVMNHGSPNKIKGPINASLIAFNVDPGVNQDLKIYRVEEATAEVNRLKDNKFEIIIEGTAFNVLDDEDNRSYNFEGYYEGLLHNSENNE